MSSRLLAIAKWSTFDVCAILFSFWLFYVHLPLSFSTAYRCSYSPHGAYAQSKLALVLFTYRLQHLLTANGSHVTANVVDPGVVNTELYKHVFWVVKLVKWMTAWLFFKVCNFKNNFFCPTLWELRSAWSLRHFGVYNNLWCLLHLSVLVRCTKLIKIDIP